jgi:hypothetical protein
MSTKLHFLPANPVDYWTLGIWGCVIAVAAETVVLVGQV